MDSIIGDVLKKEQTNDRVPPYRRVPGLKSRDDEIEEILKAITAKILVVGVGGAGNNAITRLMQVGIEGADTLAVNTDAQDLYYTNADYKLLIGKKLTGGYGAGNRPEVGEAAAEESIDLIREAVQADLVFITCGLGGGTGTGAAPVIAKAAKESGALTIAICGLPFEVEGQVKQRNAARGLEKLLENTDTLITVPNERLLEIAPNLSLSEAFRVADEVLVRAVKGIAELVSKPGLVNLDFADVRTTMRNGGMSIISMGEGAGENRVEEAVASALQNPLLDVDIRGARNVLINVSGSSDLQLQEAKRVVELIVDEVNSDAEIIWGAIIDPTLEDKIRVTLVCSGVTSPHVFGETTIKSENFDLEDDLGLEKINFR